MLETTPPGPLPYGIPPPAHRLPAATRVGGVHLLVGDLARSLYLSAPDGLGLEVCADRPQHTWQHHDRQLDLAADRLDIGSVIAAADGVAWDGAPAGTTAGHVHLHELQAGGYVAERTAGRVIAPDPRGTRVSIRGERRNDVETR